MKHQGRGCSNRMVVPWVGRLGLPFYLSDSNYPVPELNSVPNSCLTSEPDP